MLEKLFAYLFVSSLALITFNVSNNISSITNPFIFETQLAI